MKVSKINFKKVLRLLGLSLILGVFCGVVGTAFSCLTSIATSLRAENTQLLYLLPLGGLFIVFLYKALGVYGQGTPLVIESADSKKTVSPLLSVAIIISASLSHLFGASVGREGAAVQIGGSLSAIESKIFKLNEQERQILVRVGMASVFSAVFGAPLAAFFFAVEVVTVGRLHLKSVIPCLLASFTAYLTSHLCGGHAERFRLTVTPSLSVSVVLKIIVLIGLSALLSYVFCITLHLFEKLASSLFKNPYIRIALGGVIIILLSLIVGTQDYNGAGINIIENAINHGNYNPEAFALKLLFTAVSVGFGYKGGEIVPTLFVGALFGAAAASVLALPVPFAAALCMILLFCGVTNCPLAAIALGFELFSSVGFWYFIPTVAVGFIVSGKISLYPTQRFALNYKITDL